MAAVIGWYQNQIDKYQSFPYEEPRVRNNARRTDQQVILFEPISIPSPFQILSDAHISLHLFPILLLALGRASRPVFLVTIYQIQPKEVEPEDVQQHPPQPRIQQVLSLDKDGREVVAGPFEQAEVAGDAKRHRGGDGADFFVSEEGEEVGVRWRVANDLRAGRAERGRGSQCVCER